MKQQLERPYVPIITPVYNGKFDEISFANVADNIIFSECNGLLILGKTGEGDCMPCKMKEGVTAFSSKNYGQGQIIVGTSCMSFDETERLTKYAADKGIRIVALTPLFGTKRINPSEYVAKATNGTGLEVVIYNNPNITGGINLTLREISDLAAISNVVGIKDSSGDIEYLKNMKGLISPSFKIFTGTQSELEQSFEAVPNLSGFVPSSGNTSPELIARIWKYRSPFDFAELRNLTCSYKRFNSPAHAEKIIAYGQKLIRSAEMLS